MCTCTHQAHTHTYNTFTPIRIVLYVHIKHTHTYNTFTPICMYIYVCAHVRTHTCKHTHYYVSLCPPPNPYSQEDDALLMDETAGLSENARQAILLRKCEKLVLKAASEHAAEKHRVLSLQ